MVSPFCKRLQFFAFIFQDNWVFVMCLNLDSLSLTKSTLTFFGFPPECVAFRITPFFSKLSLKSILLIVKKVQYTFKQQSERLIFYWMAKTSFRLLSSIRLIVHIILRASSFYKLYLFHSIYKSKHELLIKKQNKINWFFCIMNSRYILPGNSNATYKPFCDKTIYVLSSFWNLNPDTSGASASSPI